MKLSVLLEELIEPTNNRYAEVVKKIGPGLARFIGLYDETEDQMIERLVSRQYDLFDDWWKVRGKKKFPELEQAVMKKYEHANPRFKKRWNKYFNSNAKEIAVQRVEPLDLIDERPIRDNFDNTITASTHMVSNMRFIESFKKDYPKAYKDLFEYARQAHKKAFDKDLSKREDQEINIKNVSTQTVTDLKGIVVGEWLLHLTTPRNARKIIFDGMFKKLIIDPKKLAISKSVHLRRSKKGNSGYGFAYRYKDINNLSDRFENYGGSFILFKANGALIDHKTDKEQQVVFYGPSVKNIVIVSNNDGNFDSPKLLIMDDNGSVLRVVEKKDWYGIDLSKVSTNFESGDWKNQVKPGYDIVRFESKEGLTAVLINQKHVFDNREEAVKHAGVT